MKYKSILLFGAPGSGKGTQGQFIAALPGFKHISTGDMFRALDPDSEMGKTARSYSSKGQLVPDEFTVNLWAQYTKGLEMTFQLKPATQFLLLDGIPRNVAQCKLMDDKIEVVKIVHLACRDMTKMVERLKKRAIKEKRADDADEKVIRNRLEVYAKETQPVLDYYPKDKVAEVDATLSMIGVFSEIVKALVPVRDAMDAAK